MIEAPAWDWLYPALVLGCLMPAVALAIHRRAQRTMSADTAGRYIEGVVLAMPAHLPENLSPGLERRLEALQRSAGDCVQLIGPVLWWELHRGQECRYYLARHGGGKVAPHELGPLTASEVYPCRHGAQLTLRKGYGIRFGSSAAGWTFGERPNDAAKAFLRRFS